MSRTSSARLSYLKTALNAATMLTVAPASFLDHMDNRAYYTRVRDANLNLYRREIGQ